MSASGPVPELLHGVEFRIPAPSPAERSGG
ncbi:MAG: hypothetical protein JWQ26_3088 [Modestobacter sp.]|jgi:hypothetical protein|nr:hypothetical protein [Modestobacter sp.]